MDKRASISLALAGAMTLLASPGPKAQLLPVSAACRHDAQEQQADRTRREQALRVARAINAEQGVLAQRTRRYHPLADLTNLPDVPNGFELRLYSDGAGYVFSVKDTFDSCRYAIFSDQSGVLYEKTALTAPSIAS
jgi:hypothetical protein